MGMLKTLHLRPKSGKRKVGKPDGLKPRRPEIKIEIISDTTSPFAYLLYKRLHTAMRQFEEQLDFRVHWIAYQLQPFAPAEGVEKQEFFDTLWKGKMESLVQMYTDFLKEDGLHVTLEGVYGNTFSSHRLVAYAQQQSLEKADEVMGRLLHACHGQGRHINDAQVLREIAREAKLTDPDRVADDPHCCEDVVQKQLDSMYKDVIGIPHMVINEGQIRLGGVKDTDDYLKAFQALLDTFNAEAESRLSSESVRSRSTRADSLPYHTSSV